MRKTKTTKATKSTKEKSSHGGNFHIEFKNDAQSIAWTAFKQHDVLFMVGPAGTGKALTMDSNLFAKSGPIKMRDVKVGDEVANPDGSFSRVTGVFPQGIKPVYRVYFHDGTHVDCCREHLWSVSNLENGWKNKVVDTSYLEKNCRGIGGKRVLSIECCQPVNFDRREYAIDPYLMGVIISEASLISSVVSCETETNCVCKTKSAGSVFIINEMNKHKEELKNLDLWEKRSWEKFIPDSYFYGSVDQRISLLQGLMDVKGACGKKGNVIYCTTSWHLSNDFCQLIYSLGGIARIEVKEGDGSTNRVSYLCHVNLPDNIYSFLLSRKKRTHLSRKKHKLKRYVDRVEVLPEQEMQCISVDHDRHLYLTDNFTVTHNTHLACAFAIDQILSKERKRIILTRPIVEAGESLGFLPGEFDEKVQPYMMPMYDCIDSLVGKEGLWRERVDGAVEVAPIAYMRGRALLNTESLITPTGTKLMGDVKVGDYVIGSNGKPTKVVGVYPQGTVQVYEIGFSDNTKSFCSGDHLWSVRGIGDDVQSVKTTLQIMEDIKCTHMIPVVSSPVEFTSKQTSISPYLLGVILGSNHTDELHSIKTADHAVIDECMSLLPEWHDLIYKGNCEYNLRSNTLVNEVKVALRGLKIYGKLAHEKFIPDLYKFNSPECRLALLHGLMDVGGSRSDTEKGKLHAEIYFQSPSERLVNDVAFLVRSLGGLAVVLPKNGDNHVVEISLPMNPFKKSNNGMFYNKQDLIKTISYIVPVEKDKCTCIAVDAEDRLYLTNDFIVTHNTFHDAVCIFDEAQNASILQLKLFLTRFGENSKIIITGDPSQSDLAGKVALIEVMHKLRGVSGIGFVEFKANSIVRHPLVGKIIEKLET